MCHRTSCRFVFVVHPLQMQVRRYASENVMALWSIRYSCLPWRYVGVRHRKLWRCGPAVTAVYHAGNVVGLGVIAGYVVVNVMSLKGRPAYK